ncbi:MAG TPA: hypothetical protein VEL07_00735 [Planctomycetota bacterium]|nr:hypothetical protein [Planctomycetota bacterium]
MTATSRGAFTLIEAAIAVALGALLVLSAWSAVRLVGGTVTATNRLATENALLRAGWFAVAAEADGWQLVDDPGDARRLRLRARARGVIGPGWRGAPFTPLPPNWPRSGVPGAEDERGFDPGYAWPANDPRTWFHGNIAQQDDARTDRRFGRYEIFTHLREDITLTMGAPAYGAARPAHTWWPNQLEGLRDHLGYYGAIDYMPGSTIWAVYGAGANTAAQADDDWGREWMATSWRFNDSSIGEGYWLPRGLYAHTNNAAYAIVPAIPDSALAGADDAAVVNANSATSPVGQYATTAQVATFAERTIARRALLPLRPASWPAAEIGVQRLIGWRRFVTSCRIGWRSALSGERRELTFTMLSTTLRGARQQRRLSDDPASADHDRDLDGGRISDRCDVRADLR